MDVITAIKTRRSIGVVKPDPVPKESVEAILEAGTWAPCHHRTEPWRFFVLTGDGRNRLGNLFAQMTQAKMEGPLSEEDQKRLEREKNKPLRAPVIITVAVEPSEQSKVLLQEEFAAVHAAVQNMLLTAHSLGLGAVWRTGDICYAPEVKEFFGLTGKSEVVGFLYIGYSDIQKELKGKRKHFSEVTQWMD
ncbi:nitroreductase family protein [Peribacillus asahii]|uniref:nitroreductase family protein n=1 Tax=Peribacillus asahii TaxID=228899 RepID=UPI0020792DF4|nr:nitroreductase [Peribacillus asahii]USK60975.1 nitroreductase [Peribacillus asahii]